MLFMPKSCGSQKAFSTPRSHAKQKFARLRSDVLTKLELLDAKHVQDIVYQLKRLMAGLSLFHRECQEIMAGDPKLFPVEVDLNQVWRLTQLSFCCPLTMSGIGVEKCVFNQHLVSAAVLDSYSWDVHAQRGTT